MCNTTLLRFFTQRCTSRETSISGFRNFDEPSRARSVVSVANPSVIRKEICSGLTGVGMGGLRGDNTNLLAYHYLLGSLPIFSCL